MGNTSQKSAEQAKVRRYSRSSRFVHWMDNISDKKLLKITMKQSSAGSQGTFTLHYTDESSDDFLTVKAQFTYTGTYQQVSVEDEHRELFGVGILVSPNGVILPDEDIEAANGGHPNDSEKQKTLNKRSESMHAGSKQDLSPGESYRSLSEMDNKAVKRVTRFFTEKITCKLMEGNSYQTWTITQSTEPDCLETSPQDIESRVSWVWNGVGNIKCSHSAPPGTLDFIGEENFESNGSSSIDLKIRIPQLEAYKTPVVLVFDVVTGWKLGKTSLLL